MPRKRVKKRAPTAPPRRALHYKVVELSAVDEAALERTLNEWCTRGWTFDGVQFAMRESSKRPSMAFVFFTREGAALAEPAEPHGSESFREPHAADAHLQRIAHAPHAPRSDPWSRLHALAEGDE